MEKTTDAADLLKAAKEFAIELWKKAKSHFHKMATTHAGMSKCMSKAAEHHGDDGVRKRDET